MVAALEALERGKVGYTVKSASTPQMPIPTGVRLRHPEAQATSISKRDSNLESLFYGILNPRLAAAPGCLQA